MIEVIDLISRRARALLSFLLILAGGLAPALAQDADPNPQFLIERIVVEGIERASAREIVAAETRLHEGQPYTEPALREAIYRVKRLPFVLDAEFSLRKGSERGNYELVITVEPTRPVFFLAQTDGFILKPEDRFGRDAIQTSSYGSVGARQFLGAKGLLFASVDKRERSAPSYQLGYTHYNPFGSGSYATVGGFWIQDDQGALDRRSSNLSLEVGVPIAANQSLRGIVSWGQDDYDFEFEAPFSSSKQDADSWSGALEWIHDTRDDPLFPTRGDRLTASTGYSQTDFHNRYEAQIFEGEIASFEERYRQENLYTSVGATRYFRLTGRQSVSLGAITFYQTSEVDRPSRHRRNWNAAATAGHSVSLWGYEKTERIGDLRFESQISVGYDHSRSAGFSSSGTAASLAAGLTFRNAWGIVRATLFYTEDEL
jgi:hypothetical protein